MYPQLTTRSTRPTTPNSTLFTDAWVKATGHVANSIVEANRAALSTFTLPPTSPPESVESVSYSEPDWELDRSVTDPEAISVGDSVRFTKAFSEDDVQAFATASGDTNRLHLEDDYAAETRFNGRIVHGTLVSGLISAALARLPGLTIYLSQDVAFQNPVRIGDRVTAVVEVVEELGDNRYRLTTDVVDDDLTYMSGEAVVLIDPRPDDHAGTDED